ncbi:creatininase family protein [Baaleninema simplex]|uniref:creatininase family protein n=1 Tax=Baaleninema simplex TaxID=2862350 RepID=UPI00034D3F62|nr:creatininase family protein [Baaleninema simplex]
MNGFIPPHRFFPYLTWTEIDRLANKQNVVLVQPVGAIEQHGPHLPLIVDSAIGVAVLGKALDRLEAEVPAYALPPLHYGKSNEHQHFPGTVSLSAETLLATLHDIADSLYRAGFRKLILMNSHGGQPQIMEIAATDIHAKYEDFWVFPVFTWRVSDVYKSLVSEEERQLAMHAGDAETSLMLAVLPEWVRQSELVKEYPPPSPPGSRLAAKGALTFSWLTQDISQSGVVGDATAATKEKGERILDSLADGWKRLIREVYEFEL